MRGPCYDGIPVRIASVVRGDRKFLDYAFPPTHTALDVVSNTGARVGWHNSPLPGPFFLQEPAVKPHRSEEQSWAVQRGPIWANYMQ